MFDKARILAVILVSLIVSGAFMLLPETSGLLSDAEYNALHGFATGASGSSFTNVSLDGAMHDSGPITMSRMSNSRNSLFRHRGVAVESSSQQQHYAVSNISYSLSAGNANANFGVMSSGASSSMVVNASTSISMPIYTTSGASSAKGRVHSTDANSVSWASPQTSALAMSSVYSSYSSVYASSMASGYQTVANGSVSGNFGGKGPMRAAPGFGESDFGSWLNGLEGNTDAGYLYSDEDGKLYFDMAKLREWFDNYYNNSGGVVQGVTYTWDDFLAWFFVNGYNMDEGYGSSNEWYRVPMHDGTWWLIFLALGNALMIYFRSRKQKSIVE